MARLVVVVARRLVVVEVEVVRRHVEATDQIGPRHDADVTSLVGNQQPPDIELGHFVERIFDRFTVIDRLELNGHMARHR